VRCVHIVNLARALILVKILSIARLRPCVPEEEEGEPVHPEFHNPDSKRDDEQEHIGD
jgi:hypothetical protein